MQTVEKKTIFMPREKIREVSILGVSKKFTVEKYSLNYRAGKIGETFSYPQEV